MTNNVVRLGFGAHAGMQPNQVLDFSKSDHLKELLVIGYDHDGNLVIRSSQLTRRDALWLLEMARAHVTEVDE